MSNNDEMKKYMRIVESASKSVDHTDAIDDIVSLCNSSGFMITPQHVQAYMAKGENGLMELIADAEASMDMDEWYHERIQVLHDLVSKLYTTESLHESASFYASVYFAGNEIDLVFTQSTGGYSVDAYASSEEGEEDALRVLSNYARDSGIHSGNSPSEVVQHFINYMEHEEDIELSVTNISNSKL